MRYAALLLVVIAALGWHFRGPLQERLEAWRDGAPKQAMSAVGGESGTAEPRKDTVYRWVDERGVVHFDQHPRDGSEAVVIDQARIRPMEPIDGAEVSESGSPVVTLPASDQEATPPSP